MGAKISQYLFKCHTKFGKKLRLNSVVSVRINFGSIRAIMATPLYVFHIFLQLQYGSHS